MIKVVNESLNNPAIGHVLIKTLKPKRGIPESNLDNASFVYLVAGSRIELPTSGL